MRALIAFTSVIALYAFSADSVLAKSKAKPVQNGASVTKQDIQTCIGGNGSSPKSQVPACTKIIESGKIKHPYEADYYALRGAASYKLRQFDKSLADFDKAIAIRAKPEMYFERALAHIGLKDMETAKADLTQVIKLKPKFAPSFFMRGLIAYHAGEYADAVKDFDDAVQRLPTYYQAIFARGVAKKQAGDQGGGDKDIRQARGMSAHVEKDMEKLGLKL